MAKLKHQGAIYIVATPIGNLGDITFRAIETLKFVDQIVAEHPRHSQKLLKHFAIEKPLIALHEHNEKNIALKLVNQVENGVNLALISDAGTPLINDPGYPLVRLAHERGVRVVPIPGVSSILAALSASGLATDSFIFEGFLATKSAARRKQLEIFVDEKRTLIFFEAPHRILETLKEMVKVFGKEREAVIARELTKTFETIRHSTLSELLEWVEKDPMQQRGEFVIVLAGIKDVQENELTPEATHILKVLLSELSVKDAANIAAKITGISKRVLYEYAIKLS